MNQSQLSQVPVGANSAALQGKVALVTGGGRGLGRSIAEALAAAGADLVLVSRSAEQLADAAAGIGAFGRGTWARSIDIGSAAGIDALVAEIGSGIPAIDIVVHAAGTQVRKPAVDMTVEDWDTVMAVNVRSGFLLSSALVRASGGQGPSRHIFVTSLTSSIGIANTSAYAASKSAVLGLVRSLSVEWAPLGMTVNALQPGYFHTDLTDAVFADPERRQWIESRIPVGRVGVGADLAGAAVFLASESSSYITGQQLAVDGGWLAS